MSNQQRANEIARALESSKRMPLRPHDERLLEGTRSFAFGTGGHRPAWSVGDGPIVALVHGWGGRGVQMAPLAHDIAKKGYRCIFFDAGGHGDAGDERIGFHTFIDDCSRLAESLNESIFAWIGHSAGGLGMMAARRLRGLEADRYACLAAPLYPYVPIDTLRKSTGVAGEVLELVKPILAAQFQSEWDNLVLGSAYSPEPGKRLLLIYDRDDERVRPNDHEAIAPAWENICVVHTQGYGHNRILHAPEALTSVGSFVASPT